MYNLINAYKKEIKEMKVKKILKSKYLLIAKHNDDAIQKKANILCNTIDVFNHLIVLMQSPL